MVLNTRRATTTWGYDDARDRVVLGWLCVPDEARRAKEWHIMIHALRTIILDGLCMVCRKTRDGGGILGIASMARRFDRLTSGLIYR